MEAVVDAWLSRRIGPIRPGSRMLVLCRTRATVARVRRFLAQRGGALGVEVATPTGLAQQVWQPPLLAGPPPPVAPLESSLPAENPMAPRIGARPGLAAAARRWVQHHRAAARAGVELPCPAWVRELSASGWAAEADERCLHELLEAALARGPELHAGARWDRVVALGFEQEPAAVAPWEPVLVQALTGAPPEPPPDERAGPLPAIEVPDVVAEARYAAALAAEDPHGTLILVADGSTARRVRDTLARNGVPCAWRDTEALSVHEVASAVRRCATWFADAPDPAIQVADLAFVLARTSLRAKLHPAAEASITRELAAAELEAVHLDRRRLIQVLEQARLLDAPLSAWIARLGELANGGSSSRTREQKHRVAAGAIAVRARLRLLAACLQARPIEELLTEADGELAWEPDDFEDVLAQLLGEEAMRGAPPPGPTLGAMKRFLTACRLRVYDDPVAKTILGALGQRAGWPAGLAWVHQALSGSFDPGVLSDGVDVLEVEDWDGRPCRTLVLLDVHERGLARRAPPDPLLTDAELTALGVLPGREAVHHRLRVVRRAAACAERTIAVVARRDAGGRDVVPPVLLDLQLGDTDRAGTYGLRLPLPELRCLSVLEAVGGAPEAPAHEQFAVRHLATQASAEWVREGQGPRVAAPAADPGPQAPLADRLAAVRPIAPSWVLPYLGHAEGVPEAALPAGPHSVSRLVGPLARCPWQAFARVVLELKEPPSVTEDLDPKEIGDAVHQALEAAGPSLRWRTGDADPDTLIALLRAETAAAFQRQVATLGALSPARVASAEGRRLRWSEHWDSWVRSRMIPPGLPRFWPEPLRDHPAVLDAERVARAQVPALADEAWWRLRAWILAESRAEGAPAGVPGEALLGDEKVRLPESAAPDLPALLDRPELRKVASVRAEAGRALSVWRDHAAMQAVASELPFGEDDAEPVAVVGSGVPDGTRVGLPPIALRLGSDDLPLRGRIDRVEWIATATSGGFAVVDFKTGARMDGNTFRRSQYSLKDPQLLVYAMVLERARREGLLPPSLAEARPAVVAHDRVEHTLKADAGTTLEAPDTWMPSDLPLLGWAAQRLGSQVDDARAGRWTLHPRSDTCPRVATWGGWSCPAAAACRLRGLPVAGQTEEP